MALLHSLRCCRPTEQSISPPQGAYLTVPYEDVVRPLLMATASSRHRQQMIPLHLQMLLLVALAQTVANHKEGMGSVLASHAGSSDAGNIVAAGYTAAERAVALAAGVAGTAADATAADAEDAVVEAVAVAAAAEDEARRVRSGSR